MKLTYHGKPAQEMPLKSPPENDDPPMSVFTITCEDCGTDLHTVEPEHRQSRENTTTVQDDRIYRSLRSHADRGHEIQLSFYGDNTGVENVAIECTDCYEVLHDIEPSS